MRDRVLNSAHEHMYGTQEAARYLGIHRSTLHLAVRQGLIVPDERTPGGHVRFSKETLNRFREHLTSGPVTGEEIAMAPLRAQASVAHLLATQNPIEPQAIGAEVVKRVLDVLRDIDACCVTRWAPEPHEPYRLRLVAQQGFPDSVLKTFSRMRASHTFATTTALKTLQPEVSEDVTQQYVHEGTVWLSRTWPIGAYVVLPIVAGERGAGVLICVSHCPRHFSRQEMLFLHSMADLLAVAFDSARATNSRILAAMRMMRLAMDLRTGAADSGEAPQALQRGVERVSPLVQTFLRYSGAQHVSALGFDVTLPSYNSRLAGLACAACATENAAHVLHEAWDEKGVYHTALATSIPLSMDTSLRQESKVGADGVRRGAVVALWHDIRPEPGVEDLLVTFACAYLLAIG